MNEYIELEPLIGDLKDVIADYKDEHNFSTDFAATIVTDILDNIVKCQPAADVAPVRHGRWLCVDTDTEQFFLCNRCKKKEYWESDYCPSCGAKMDGGQYG